MRKCVCVFISQFYIASFLLIAFYFLVTFLRKTEDMTTDTIARRATPVKMPVELLSEVLGDDIGVPLPPLEAPLMLETGVIQSPFVMVLVSSVTAPFRANNCPCTVAPVCAAIDVNAKMCPTK
jgi:hypothetical protein